MLFYLGNNPKCHLKESMFFILILNLYVCLRLSMRKTSQFSDKISEKEFETLGVNKSMFFFILKGA
jgi:hypothetical protein